MRKLFLLSLAALALSASAQGSYTADFNTAVDTSDPAFRAAPGWRHLVHTGAYSSQIVTYTYVTDNGVDGSGCIQAGAQSYFDWWEDAEVPLYDLLITPAVGGTVTLQVMKANSSDNCFVEFYKVTKTDGNWVRGEQITYEDPGLLSIDYTEVELTGIEEGTYIGIRANNVYIDDFTATSANVELERALTITQVIPAIAEQNIDCDENNQFEIKATVKVKNTGEVDLTAGGEGYNLQIALMGPNDAGAYVVERVLSTQAIETDLAMGAESDEIVLTALVDESSIEPVAGNDTKARRYDVVEGVTHTTKPIHNYTPVPYAPIASLYDGMSELTTGSELDLGATGTEATKTVTLYNDGAAPLQLTALAVEGEGFSTEATVTTIAKHEHMDITIKLASSTPGAKTGSLTIQGEGIDDIAVNLKGEVVDPNKWFVNFEDGQMPNNMINLGNWQVSNKLVTGINKYYATNDNADPTMLISPKMEVAEGDNMSFAAARNYGDVSKLEVYYSTDRKNWTLVRTLDINAENEADQLTSDYTGTAWGSNTKYNFTRFTIDNIPAGEVYVAFAAGNARIDDIVGYKLAQVEHDAFVTSATIPTVAMVNNPINVVATLRNMTENVEAADSYTARFYLNGEVVAETEATELASNGENTYQFTAMAHETGTFEAYVEFAGDNFNATSPTYMMTITEELATAEIQVGDVKVTDQRKNAPLELYNNKSESETIYPSSLLNLSPGTKITRIAFRGKGTSNKDITANVQVWLENTEDATPQNVLLDAEKIAAMTQVYNGSYAFSIKTETSEVLVVELAEPFVYTGQNLRVCAHSESSGWATTYFEQDNTVTGQSIYRASDTSLPATFTACNLPVMYLTVSNEPVQMSGRVTDQQGNGIADATITLTARAIEPVEPIDGAPRRVINNNVTYTATTDADGNYTMQVFQAGLQYDVVVEAEGYETATDVVDFAAGNLDKDFVLTSTTTGINDVNAEVLDENAPIYDIMGRRLTSKPSQGIYIQNGRKYIAR